MFRDSNQDGARLLRYCTGTGEREKLGKEVYLAGTGVTIESP